MMVPRKLLPHLIAGGLALSYAWFLSGTRFVTTGVQFVSPLGLILVLHVVWLIASAQAEPGYARRAYRQTLLTSLGIAACTALFAIYAPFPATASTVSETLGTVAGVIACLAVLALVVVAAAAAVAGIGYGFHLLFRSIRSLLRRWSGRPLPRTTDSAATAILQPKSNTSPPAAAAIARLVSFSFTAAIARAWAARSAFAAASFPTYCKDVGGTRWGGHLRHALNASVTSRRVATGTMRQCRMQHRCW